MLVYLLAYEDRIEHATAWLRRQSDPCSPELAAAIIRDAVEGLESLIADCKRQFERNQIEQRDSLIGYGLRTLDAYAALIRYGEERAGQRLDVPRTILDQRAYWEEQDDPVKLYTLGNTFSA